MFKDAVGRAEMRLTASLTINAIAEVINLIRSHAEKSLLIVAEDEQLALRKQSAIQQELSNLEYRWQKNQEEQRRRRQDLQSEKALGDLLQFGATALAIASLFFQAFGAVAALAAVYDAMVKVAALAGSSGGSVVDDFVDFSKPSLRPEAKKAYKDATAFFDATKQVFSAAETIRKASQATADDKLNKILGEAATLVMERGRLVTAAGQAALEMNVVLARKAAAEQLRAEAINALARSSDSERALASLSLLLVTEVRLYADTLHRYHFDAARALQRWLFDESRLSLFCAYGWIDPEVETRLTEPAAPNLTPDELISKRREELIAYLASLQSTTSPFDFAGLPSKFDKSLEAINYSSITIQLTPNQVAELTSSGSVRFRIAESDLTESVRAEAHVEDVQVLDSVASGVGFDVSAALSRNWSARMANGQLRTGVDDDRSVVVRAIDSPTQIAELVGTTLATLRRDGPAPKNAFWACSPIREWTLSCDPSIRVPTDIVRTVDVTVILSGQKSAA